MRVVLAVRRVGVVAHRSVIVLAAGGRGGLVQRDASLGGRRVVVVVIVSGYVFVTRRLARRRRRLMVMAVQRHMVVMIMPAVVSRFRVVSVCHQLGPLLGREPANGIGLVAKVSRQPVARHLPE
jgi:hypothetical protein